MKIFTNKCRLYIPHLCMGTGAEMAVAALCAAQAHSPGGVPCRALGTRKKQPGLESEGGAGALC